jgi:hypothetical protein
MQQDNRKKRKSEPSDSEDTAQELSPTKKLAPTEMNIYLGNGKKILN